MAPKKGITSVLSPITTVERCEHLPLSFAQQRLWFLHQLQPDGAVYNIPAAVRLDGHLDVMALADALQAIVERHEALRTTFPSVDGVPHQHIAPNLDMPLPLTDISALALPEREAHVQGLVQAEAADPFDLSVGPLIRSHLIRLASAQHVLLLTMHHIISDGWSMGILTQELSSVYSAFSQGQPNPLSPLALQYADFALWQRQHLQGPVLDAQLAYWTEQLKDAPVLTELPTDRARPAAQRHQGRQLSFAIPHAIVGRLKTLSRRQNTSLFMTLLAAFSVLLHRYSRQSDIVIGTPIANRNHLDTEALIGFFVNTLALRTRINSRQNFTELLEQVRETTLDAYAHQDLPFEQLVDELKLPRSLAHAPLLQIMFVMQNTPQGELTACGLTFSGMESDAQVAKFDLTLGMIESSTGLRASLEYNTDLFDHSTIERMARHFTRLLDQLGQQPQTPLHRISLLDQVESQQIASEWNTATPTAYPPCLVHHLFESQAERSPEAVALVFEDQSLSYRQLNEQANRVAHYLIEQGIRSDQLVALCMERSPQMIVGLLGILKAGAGYLPLDPDYPTERLAYMIDDAGVRLLLSQRTLLTRLALPGTLAIFCPDEQPEVLGRQLTRNPRTDTHPSHLAYCIYTSGSTGWPKGVQVSHEGISMHCQAIGAIYGMTPEDRELHFLSIGFDGAHERWLTPLCYGACVVLRGQDLWSVQQTHHRLIRDRITVAAFPPSYLHQLADWALQEGRAPGVKTYCFAGEAFNRKLLHHVISSLQPQWVINGYGPTETVITPTLWRASAQTADFDGCYAPIGRHVGDRQTYVLDEDLNVVPVGVIGELYIAGQGLARGYLRAPGMTATRFVPNPFDTRGTRMYRTGDLVRYLPDGNLEFFGRIDNQVKLRGFRIELGEIEAALCAQPSIQDAVVLVREDEPGHRQLVAYLTGTRTAVDANSLLGQLKRRLPAHMLPAHFIHMDTWPLTPGGKLNRQALPPPSSNRDQLGSGYFAPRNATEQKLANLYAHLLKLDKVGAHDNFFELGGHSLLAMQLVSKIQRVFSIELPVRMLFEAPCVDQLTEVILAIIQLSSPPEAADHDVITI